MSAEVEVQREAPSGSAGAAMSALTRTRPILFSGSMVRAILEGRKGQTRRIVNTAEISPSIWSHGSIGAFRLEEGSWQARAGEYNVWSHEFTCPYGQPGDRLWVREAFALAGPGEDAPQNAKDKPCYMADWPGDPSGVGWKPSIHMPRWASRLTLEVIEVRVERVQEITWQDALAEGVEYDLCCNERDCGCQGVPVDDPTLDFQDLWDSLNVKRGHSWGSNPWVWVVSFKVIELC